MEAHKPECRGIGQTAVRVEMPEEGKNKLAFQNHHKQLPVPFVIYADCEALTTKIAGPELDPSKSNTHKTQHHEACGYSYVVVRCDGETSPPTVYRGPDTMERFLKSLQEEERKIKVTLANPQAMRMTPDDRRTHNNSTHCHVCAGPLASDSVRDHCHITGKYRGAAHNACNLKLRLNPKTTTIPVVFHNLRDYDSHLLMQAMSKVEGKVSCIPNNTEKYISLSLGQLRFIDSAQFLLASLNRLVSANQPEAFRVTAKYEPDEEKRSLLFRKGVYPYEYMDSWGRFTEPPAPAERGLLQQTIGRAHQRRRLWPRAKSLGDLWVSQPGGLPRPLPPYGRPPPGRCLRDLSEDLPTAVWIGSRPLLHQPRPLLGCAAQENRSRTRATHRL